MFPRAKRSQKEGDKDGMAEEERIASRLHLNLGRHISCRLRAICTDDCGMAEHDSMVRKSKTADAKAPKVVIFRGVLFEDWLRMFMQVGSFASAPYNPLIAWYKYAFLLTQRNRFDVADEVLRHVLQSNAYQARGLQNTLRLALIGACGQIVDRH